MSYSCWTKHTLSAVRVGLCQKYVKYNTCHQWMPRHQVTLYKCYLILGSSSTVHRLRQVIWYNITYAMNPCCLCLRFMTIIIIHMFPVAQKVGCEVNHAAITEPRHANNRLTVLLMCLLISSDLTNVPLLLSVYTDYIHQRLVESLWITPRYCVI